ncbi:MAG TPA: DUF423 domain-containing protein [Fimbriimonas sp.]
MKDRLLPIVGLLGLAAVALGAFGTHGLRARVDASVLATWGTAVHYHMFHTLALMGVSLLADRVRGSWTVAWLFLAGIVVFSGSLYLYVLTGTATFARITPVGGLFFLMGWAWLAVSSWKTGPANRG